MLTVLFQSAFSQTIKPGNITEGLANYKGASSVDFKTGIMNYNIPLLSLEQDGYTIPISMNYTASGIKVNNRAGDIAGLGWSLNFGGGVISRTVRGGYADENITNGILANPIPNPTSIIHEKKIAAGKIDGESDIFTVNIKGGTIRFILAKEGGVIVAKPLEKTDVVIKCHYDVLLYGFEITDDEGNKYLFSASNAGRAFIKRPATGSTYQTALITSWYLTKIMLANNSDIDFEYMNEEYVEQIKSNSEYFVSYGVPLSLPKLNHDQTLNDRLDALYGTITSGDKKIDDVKNQIENANLSIDVLERDAQRREGLVVEKQPYMGKILVGGRYFPVIVRDVIGADDGGFNDLAQNFYRREIEERERYINDINAGNEIALSQINSILDEMYYTDYSKSNAFGSNEYNNLLVNKLIKKIITRNGTIEFDYIELAGSNAFKYVISGIKYKNANGDLSKQVTFDFNARSFLKTIQLAGASKNVEHEYKFDYYNENDGFGDYAQDYWGFYNGKETNTTLFPYDVSYNIDPLNTNNAVFGTQFSGLLNYSAEVINSFGGFADRYPDGTKAIARSLKSVTTMLGGKVSFEYEGNEVYSQDANKNVPVGGIRIKSITSETGASSLTTNYKYKFPLLSNLSISKSTGRLVDWKQKHLAYPYHYNTGTDVYVYTDFMDMGSNYNDNSNNGVLYHYVEEVKPDNSATGFKYMEVDASAASTIQHSSYLDNLMIARISYNSSGRIVSVERNKYTTNNTYVSDRSTEYTKLGTKYNYLVGGITTHAISNGLQLKSDPVNYDYDELNYYYPDQNQIGTMFNSYYYGINPYQRMFLPNWAPRCNSSGSPIYYQLTTGTVVLPEETTNYMFNTDYDMGVAYASSNFSLLPDEKAYLYERLINAPGIPYTSTKTVYSYNGQNHLNPTDVRVTKSNGDVYLNKIKYAGDYSLTSTHPISHLKDANRISEAIENQTWLSKTSGGGFKLMSGSLSEFASKTVSGKEYLLPSKQYALQPNTPIAPGHGELVTNLPPYTSVFWDGGTLYKENGSIDWAIHSKFSRNTGVKDQTGYNTKTVKYDPYRGNLLLETQGVDPLNACALDRGPSLSYPYYNQYGLFDYPIEYGPKSTAKFTDYPLTIQFVSAYNLDHALYTEGAYEVLNNFKEYHPVEYGSVYEYPRFMGMFETIEAIYRKDPINVIIKAIDKYRSSPVDPVKENDILLNYVEKNELSNYMYVLLNYIFYDANTDRLRFDNHQDVLYRVSSTVLPVEDGPVYTQSMNVEKLVADGVNVDLFMVIQNGIGGGISYKLKYKDGSLSSTRSYGLYPVTSKISKGQLVLNSLPNYLNLASIEFIYDTNIGGTFVAVPQNTSFKAYSYLPNNFPCVSFDQTGNFTEQYYDQYMKPHFIKDLKGNIIKSDSLVYAAPASYMKNMANVSVDNKYALGYDSVTNIIKITFVNGINSQTIVKDMRIISGQKTDFQIPAGNYYIKVETDRAIGKINLNGSVTSINYPVYDFYSVTVSGTTGLSLKIGPPGIYTWE